MTGSLGISAALQHERAVLMGSKGQATVELYVALSSDLHSLTILNNLLGCEACAQGHAPVVQAKVSSVMDFLEKPEKLSGTDKAEKVM